MFILLKQHLLISNSIFYNLNMKSTDTRGYIYFLETLVLLIHSSLYQLLLLYIPTSPHTNMSATYRRYITTHKIQVSISNTNPFHILVLSLCFDKKYFCQILVLQIPQGHILHALTQQGNFFLQIHTKQLCDVNVKTKKMLVYLSKFSGPADIFSLFLLFDGIRYL